MILGNTNPIIFGKRLEFLMKLDDIDITKRGASGILSKRLYERGIIAYNDQTGDDKARANQRDNTRKTIEEHRKMDSAEKLSGEWIFRYCKYFDCSADFLFGKIELPTHENSDIAQLTGLSLTAIDTLKMFNKFTIGQLYCNGGIYGKIFSEKHKPIYALSKILEVPALVSLITNYMALRDETLGFTGDDRANALLLRLAIELNKIKNEYQNELKKEEPTFD